jgi:hypothetical protein
VLYHHEPITRLEAAHPLIRMVRLAHLLCCHDDQEQAIAESARLCNLDGAQLEQIIKNAARQVEKSANYLGIDLAGADDIVAPPMRRRWWTRCSNACRKKCATSCWCPRWARPSRASMAKRACWKPSRARRASCSI